MRKSLERARAESPLGRVLPLPPSRELAGVIGGARRLGLTLDVVPVAVQQLWTRALPGVEWTDVSTVVRELRSVKSPWELARMRATAALLSGVFGDVPSFLRAGCARWTWPPRSRCGCAAPATRGARGCAASTRSSSWGWPWPGAPPARPSYFDGPVTGRGLSASSPLGASIDPIGRDVPVLLDYTAILGGYITDMTRIAVCGALAPELRRAFDVARAIQDEVAAALRPGAVPSRLFALARERADGAGLGDRFMGPPGAQARFVGHGVGLELDEVPVLAPGFDAPLRAGMTFAIEPKFVFPGQGAVGIENTFAVGEDGGERLSHALRRPAGGGVGRLRLGSARQRDGSSSSASARQRTVRRTGR